MLKKAECQKKCVPLHLIIYNLKRVINNHFDIQIA